MVSFKSHESNVQQKEETDFPDLKVLFPARKAYLAKKISASNHLIYVL
jgi:hypothetical protein